MADQEVFTRDQLEEIIRRRHVEQERVINRPIAGAVERIRPLFLGVNRRLDDLTEQVGKTNGQVLKHWELLGDLGVPDMSLAQRHALPEVLAERLEAKDQRDKLDGIERRR